MCKYVDDVLVCLVGSDGQIEVFLDFASNLHSTIKLKLS